LFAKLSWTLIEVWKENSCPAGRWVEKATPSERPTPAQARGEREAEAALRTAGSTQHIRCSGLTMARVFCPEPGWWRERGWVSHCRGGRMRRG